MEKHLFHSTPSGLMIINDLKYSRPELKMQHLVSQSVSEMILFDFMGNCILLSGIFSIVWAQLERKEFQF